MKEIKKGSQVETKPSYTVEMEGKKHFNGTVVHVDGNFVCTVRKECGCIEKVGMYWLKLKKSNCEC